MKTKIVCSKAYARSFRGELREAEFGLVWEQIVRMGRQFYEFYSPHIPCILSDIPRYTGFKWTDFASAEVSIYLVDCSGPSRSSPLTLKVRENVEYMLTVLSHELVHVNMPCKLFNNEMDCEDIVNQVTLKVCEQTGIYAGIETIKAYQKKMQKKGFVSRKLDLEKMTVREALNLNAGGGLSPLPLFSNLS